MIATLLIFASCGKKEVVENTTQTEKSVNFDTMSVSPNERARKMNILNGDKYEIEYGATFKVDDKFGDSAFVYAYLPSTDSPIRDIVFTGNFSFKGKIMGNQVFTRLNDFGQVYFRQNDVHRVD